MKLQRMDRFGRRQFLKHTALALGGLSFAGGTVFAAEAAAPDIIRRPIPSSGETIPIIGMGTYITFNVGGSSRLREERTRVMQAFLDLGGGMIDSSPMYGSSEEVVGHALQECQRTERAFSATKIWTASGEEGREQARRSEQLWQIPKIDLQQVHNLVNWEEHLAFLRQEKAAGRVRYIGITTSHGRRHRELESILRNEALDFVQLTYNIADRDTEERLIPLAHEQGVAVILNRPFDGGRLMDRYERERLPDWAAEVGVANWAEFFLKYAVSLPGVTCAIPATSQVAHMEENMGAMRGKLPDEAGRQKMAEYLARI